MNTVGEHSQAESDATLRHRREASLPVEQRGCPHPRFLGLAYIERIDSAEEPCDVGHKVDERIENGEHHNRTEQIEKQMAHCGPLWPRRFRSATRESGVIVVPMLPPRIMAQPRENEIQPCEHIISVMAKVAAELCATIVTTMPSAKKISTDKNPIDVYPTMKLSISGFSSRFGTYSLMRSRPMKGKQKPTKEFTCRLIGAVLQEHQRDARRKDKGYCSPKC